MTYVSICGAQLPKYQSPVTDTDYDYYFSSKSSDPFIPFARYIQ
jgi:hypothetical protein